MTPPNSLTAKQLRFCDEYIRHGNGATAYRASFAAENMSDNAVRVEACRLLKRPNIALRIEQARKRMAAEVEIGQDEIVRMLLADRQFAIDMKAPSAAQSATMGLAKVLGHLTEDRKNGRRPLEGWTTESLLELQHVLEQFGADQAKPSGVTH